jgi:PilZ domain
MVRTVKERWEAKLTRTLNEAWFAVGALEPGAACCLLAVAHPHKMNAGRPCSPERFADAECDRPMGLSAHKEISGMPDAISNRRVAPRYSLVLLAEITDQLSSTKFTARTSDVSRTGCYVDMLSPLPRGTQVHIRLRHEQEMFESTAKVMYVSPGLGIGVAFAEHLPASQQEILDRWLAAAAKTSR